jgi:MFS family permease
MAVGEPHGLSHATTGRNRGQLLSVVRNREFLVFSISQAFSLFGDKLDYMALLAMVAFFSATRGWQGARAISWLSVIVALPTVLFGPLAGILVDRWDRRKVMVVCDAARAVLVFAVPAVALATMNLALVYVIAFLVFLFGLFFNTARLAIIPNLVGPDRLLGANSFMNVVGRVATFLGMLLGGLIVDWHWWERLGIRPTWTAGFYFDSLTYVVSVLALLLVFRRLASTWHRPGRVRIGEVFLDRQSKMLHEVREAWNQVRRGPSVLFVYISILLMVLLGAAVFVLYIPVIQSSRELAGLGLGTKGVGIVAAIGSVGLVFSSMAYGILGHRVRKHHVILACYLLLGLIAVGLAVSRSFAPVVPLAFVAGLALSPILIAMDTMLHESVPEEVRGRVFSVREWILHLAFAVAALVIGQLTNFFPTRHMLAGTGLLVALASIAGFILARNRSIA